MTANLPKQVAECVPPWLLKILEIPCPLLLLNYWSIRSPKSA